MKVIVIRLLRLEVPTGVDEVPICRLPPTIISLTLIDLVWSGMSSWPPLWIVIFPKSQSCCRHTWLLILMSARPVGHVSSERGAADLGGGPSRLRRYRGEYRREYDNPSPDFRAFHLI